MSRYSRCPHQNASGTATLAPLHQPQLRNPWVATDRAGESQSTNSSSSSRTYRGPGGGGGGGGGPGPGPPPPLWHAPPPPLPADHFNHHPIATHPRAAHYLVDHQLEVLDGPGAATHLLAPPGPGRPPPPHAPQPQPYAASSRAASERDRPVTPASSPGGASGSAGGGAGGGAAAVDGCGGHCVAFENFCYRLLQVIFIAGILTGISLTIAGSVLRHAPSRTLSPSPSSSSSSSSSSSGGAEGGGGGRDKAVLVYIGCLVGLVCALLLAVQCCVRRNVKRRKRALRMSMAAAAAGRRGLAHAHAHAHAHASAGTLPHAHAHAHPHAHAPPPGAQQGPVHLAHGGDIPLQELQYQPLLVRLVQQQATAASSSSSGNQRLAAAAAAGPAPAHYHRPGHAAPAAYRDDLEDLDASCSGTPWWRRRGDPRHTRQPHVADTRR